MFKKLLIGAMLLASPSIAADMKTEMLEPTVKINENCSATMVDLGREGDFLLTARHCVRGEKEGFTSFVKYDGAKMISESRVYFDVLQESSKRDLALLKLREDLDIPAVKVAEELKVEEGEDVWVVGYPLAMTRTVTKGLYNGEQVILKSQASLEEDTVFYRSSPAVTGGNSGGGMYQLVDGKYELVGVTSMGIRSVEHMSMFVPVEDIRSFLNLDVVKPDSMEIDNR